MNDFYHFCNPFISAIGMPMLKAHPNPITQHELALLFSLSLYHRVDQPLLVSRKGGSLQNTQREQRDTRAEASEIKT